MAWWKLTLILAFPAAAASACAGLWGFNPLSNDEAGDAGGTDAGPPTGLDGGREDADGGFAVCGTTVCNNPPHATCTGNSTLRSYASGTCDGGQCEYAEVDTTCGAAGCCQDHCCAVVPANEPVLGGLTKTGITTTAPQGAFDTTANCTTPSALGDCAPVSQPGGPDVCVCRADDLTIGALAVTGERALAILAYDQVSITGAVSVAASKAAPGPGARPEPDAGVLSADGGVSSFSPLVGGSAGGGFRSCGGGGGGALQITAGITIRVSGSINASGGGGECSGEGGSGGAILLEAPVLDLSGAFGANGGGGSGGSVDTFGGGPGGDGTTTAGGSGGVGATEFCCDVGGNAFGGQGGTGASATVAASSGGSGQTVCNCLQCCQAQSGASGGGLGVIGLHSLGGACSCGGSTFSPTAELGQITVR